MSNIKVKGFNNELYKQQYQTGSTRRSTHKEHGQHVLHCKVSGFTDMSIRMAIAEGVSVSTSICVHQIHGDKGKIKVDGNWKSVRRFPDKITHSNKQQHHLMKAWHYVS